MEKLLGKKIDWAKFEEEVDTSMAMNKLWYDINQLRKARPRPHALPRLLEQHVRLNLELDGPQSGHGLYQKMYIEMKERVDKGISGINVEEKYRLIFLGLPPWHSLGFFDQLAERGWNFVIEQTYHPPKPIDLSWVKDRWKNWSDTVSKAWRIRSTIPSARKKPKKSKKK